MVICETCGKPETPSYGNGKRNEYNLPGGSVLKMCAECVYESPKKDDDT